MQLACDPRRGARERRGRGGAGGGGRLPIQFHDAHGRRRRVLAHSAVRALAAHGDRDPLVRARGLCVRDARREPRRDDPRGGRGALRVGRGHTQPCGRQAERELERRVRLVVCRSSYDRRMLCCVVLCGVVLCGVVLLGGVELGVVSLRSSVPLVFVLPSRRDICVFGGALDVGACMCFGRRMRRGCLGTTAGAATRRRTAGRTRRSARPRATTRASRSRRAPASRGSRLASFAFTHLPRDWRRN